MSDERYAPPQAPLADATANVAGTGRFDLGLAFNEAWSATWANFGLLLGVGIAAILLMLVSAVTVVGAFLLVPVFYWGGIRFILNVIDGRAEFVDLFSGFQDYGRVLLSMILLYVLSFLISALGQSVNLIGSAAKLPLLEWLGFLAAVGWSLLVMSRLNFAWFYAVDQGLGPVESLQASWDATADMKLNSALIFVMAFVIGMIGFMALIVGLVPALMIASLMWASAYRQMVGRKSDAS